VIVVAGEALFDLVLGGADTDTLALHPGGGPFNVARTIGRLEGRVGFLGRLSSDRLGQRLREVLAADGVSLEAVVPAGEPTTLALAELDAGGVARYRFYTAGTSAAGLTPEEAVAALPAATTMLHVGTLALVLEPTATALEALVEGVSTEILVAVDPNCRPEIIGDPSEYRGRLTRVLRRAHVVKVSDQDLSWLEPGRDAVDAARLLIGEGPMVALVTRGERDAVVVTSTAAEPVPVPAVQVVDTIGAGDAFGGAFLAWWQREGLGSGDLQRLDAVVEATRFACLVAARTCERAGASPPFRAELEP
jgi:fructokinase